MGRATAASRGPGARLLKPALTKQTEDEAMLEVIRAYEVLLKANVRRRSTYGA
jgi:hypothetical protein